MQSGSRAQRRIARAAHYARVHAPDERIGPHGLVTSSYVLGVKTGDWNGPVASRLRLVTNDGLVSEIAPRSRRKPAYAGATVADRDFTHYRDVIAPRNASGADVDDTVWDRVRVMVREDSPYRDRLTVPRQQPKRARKPLVDAAAMGSNVEDKINGGEA